VTEPDGRELRFFFPYEVQIVDAESYRTTEAGGPADHASYKLRQLASVRRRVLADLIEP